jgi:hypothetical protein
MSSNRTCLTIALAVGMVGCLSACKGSGGAAPAQKVPETVAQPQPKSTPASLPSSVAPSALPSSAAVSSPSVSTAVSDTGVAARILTADSSQSFTVAGHVFRMLKHVQRVERGPGMTPDQTVEWWELHNSKDQVVYRETYPVNVANGTFDFMVSVTATSFATKEGAGIVVERSDEPSDPMAGGSVQLFGYKYGRDKYGVDESLFQSFGPPIWVEGDYLGIGTEDIHPPPTLPRGVTMLTMDDIMKFKIWTGNFFVMYPVRINWIAGRLEPGRRCLETTSKGRTERCSFPVEVEAHLGSQPTFVRLFPEADDGLTPRHVIVQPNSKVDFLEAKALVAWHEDAKSASFEVDGDTWLKVCIDGQEGWIHSEEDFEALGVPQSG